jgi:8-amino-7-oxononanoate synthase
MSRALDRRQRDGSRRILTVPTERVDLYSNDYLGFARDPRLRTRFHELLTREELAHGSTGSRLLGGNSALVERLETRIAAFGGTEAALLYGSGYGANLGVCSCLAGRHDTILYDALIHASVRDGVRLSQGRSYSFRHNDPEDLRKKLSQSRGEVFVVVESVYSMDGDRAPLHAILDVVEERGARLIVDEAHAVGVCGVGGRGYAAELGVTDRVFAVVYTFGKALGSHGAAVLGSAALKDYLVNFSRPFIYSTAPAPHALIAIEASLDHLEASDERTLLTERISHFNRCLDHRRAAAETPIYSWRVGGIERAAQLARSAQEAGYEIRAIFSPTVPAGEERLRICLHSFNTNEQIEGALRILQSDDRY